MSEAQSANRHDVVRVFRVTHRYKLYPQPVESEAHWNWTSGLAGIPEPRYVNPYSTLPRGLFFDRDLVYTTIPDLAVSEPKQPSIEFLVIQVTSLTGDSP